MLSPARRRLFFAVALAFPWLVLLLLELGLRVGGYGSSYPLFVPFAAQREFLTINPEIGRRYFRGDAFRPTPETEFFRAAKAPGALRLFFQGESSAQGFPYGHGGAPSRMLEQRLQATFPAREIEVVNTALTAVNSYTLLDQADEIVEQQPDAVLIYTGHNEYYGAFGAGSSGALGGANPLVRAYLYLHRRLRTVQLLGAGIAAAGKSFAGRATDDAPRTVMQLMAGEQRIALGSPVYQRGLDQFRWNLGALLARYRERGIPVLIGTVASNERDQRPLAAADGPDPDSALAWFERGKERQAAGDRTGALAAFREAKERDALRFRAPEAINTIIREEAARHGAKVVETQAALARASSTGTIGSDVMLEHLHPNLDGYFVIADAFHEALRLRGIVRDWPASAPPGDARAELPVTPLDSAVGVYRTDRLTSAWPFQPRGRERVPMVDTMRPRSRVEELARAVVLGQLPWAEATERLRALAEQAGNDTVALRAARALAHEFHWSPEGFVDAARSAMRLGRDAEAVAFARAALARQERADARRILDEAQRRRSAAP